jgi:hypothetical protein
MKGKGEICCINGYCTMPDADWHGKRTGYNNHDCRCPDCTEAQRAYFMTGAGYRAREAYRARLRAAGLTSTSSWTRPVLREKPYQPRQRKAS